MTHIDTHDHSPELIRLLEYLDRDPENLPLLADAIETAVDTGAVIQADALLQRYARLAPLTPALQNLAGIIAMRQNDFDKAHAVFTHLISAGHAAPATRFNLAYCDAVSGEAERALTQIDDDMTAQLPQAAALKVQLLHAQGEFEEAMDAARKLSRLHPDHPGLMAHVSVLALDLEDMPLAREAAEKAAHLPEAITTLGTLALAADEPHKALALFEDSLAQKPDNPRAWLGRGLAQLSLGHNERAAADLDRGAEIFKDHLGSWIAAGWAYFVEAEYQASRARFDTALAIDPSFAESHGSLAVIDIVEGDMESARRRCETALRLDRTCFSGALAKSLLERADGNPDTADKIVRRAMQTPIGADGKTIGQALALMNKGAASRKKPN